MSEEVADPRLIRAGPSLRQLPAHRAAPALAMPVVLTWSAFAPLAKEMLGAGVLVVPLSYTAPVRDKAHRAISLSAHRHSKCSSIRKMEHLNI